MQKTYGKNVQLYLLDGDATGRIKCTLANWSGVAYKIPRTMLEESRDREDLLRSGVYILFGESEETGRGIGYIGQAGVRKNGEGILSRLMEHKKNPDKDYWNEVVVFTTSNNSFGPTEISYLENRLCNMAVNAGRFLVKNGNDPTPGSITEEKESELEEFIASAKLVMGVLGYKIFEEMIQKEQRAPVSVMEKAQPEEVLRLSRKSRRSGTTIDATCVQTREGFVILKGSQVEIMESENIPGTVKAHRARVQILDGVLQEDVLTKSPSFAAAFVLGGPSGGPSDWTTVAIVTDSTPDGE